MKTDTCADCVFSLKIDAPSMFCRRFPPVPVSGKEMALWPIVTTVDWCGEHVLDPPKRSQAKAA